MLPTVRVLMSADVALLREVLPALLTLEWALASMAAFVRLVPLPVSYVVNVGNVDDCRTLRLPFCVNREVQPGQVQA